MRHSPDFYRRLVLPLLAKDVVLGCLSVLLMLVLVAASAPRWVALSLALPTYAGLRMLTYALIVDDGDVSGRRSHHDDRYCFARCLGLRQVIETMSGRFDDPAAHDRIGLILARIDRILAAIAEDNKYRACARLLENLHLTTHVLAGHLRVARRGAGGPDVRMLLQQDLAALDRLFEHFWTQLNRDAVVDLEALSETIELNLLPTYPGNPQEDLERIERKIAGKKPGREEDRHGSTIWQRGTG